MSDIKYLANQRRAIEKTKQDPIMEEHHLLGKINSKEKIALPKPWHDFITHTQNSISVKYRNHPEVLALSSLIGLNELFNEQLRIFREMKLKKLEGTKDG